MKIPRILLTAPASGSGKTLITCGILQALVNRGLKVASFKCGPDYIDPMFHGKVIGTKSRNLDTFFYGRRDDPLSFCQKRVRMRRCRGRGSHGLLRRPGRREDRRKHL